ncbi:MAG: PEF-CTERM sorting domain-containing protein [Candidatus Bathyarchaeum sp.]|nr:MAG: PEF-CTERM sorting domain-containing protein [Candidatus Bathyarchaeum sp.]
MPYPGGNAAAGVTSGVLAPTRIYVLGGYPTFNLNQIYDPETDTWTMGALMPTNRYGLGVAVVDDLIYAIGGPGANAIVANERYTPADFIPEFPSWTPLLLVLTVLAVAIVIYRRKLHNPR